MTDIKLPAIGDAPVRPRRASRKAVPAETARPAKVRRSVQVPDDEPETAQAAQDLVVNDQLERARIAREAAMASQQAPQPEQVEEPELEVPVAPAPRPRQAAPVEAAKPAEYIVNDALVDALRSVKSISIPEFSDYLNELSTIIDLWRGAKTEASQRRHLLSLLLLLQEKRV